jgi:hypothetical protein
MNGLPLPDRARWLLEACLRDDRRAVEAFGKWRRFANPGQMEGRELRLTPLLHENMRRLGLSDQRLEWIGGQAKHIWLTGALRRRKLLLVLDILEGARVDFVLIKGAAMSARFPKAVATRPMADFDLLIHRSSARAAMATLHASGWSGADGAELSDADLNRHHAIGLWDPTGTSVDLHWRPAASIATCRHAEGVRERSAAAAGREAGFGRLCDRPPIRSAVSRFRGQDRAAQRLDRRRRSPFSLRPARGVGLAALSSARV